MKKRTQPPTIGRHRRRCSVCNHPDRPLIDQEFLRWRSAEQLAQQFRIPDCAAIYRHAHAFGLFEKRRLDIRAVSEQIMECAETVQLDGYAVLDALRVFTQITPDGQWAQSPKRVIVTNLIIHQDASGNAIPPGTAEDAAPKSAQTSGVGTPEVGIPTSVPIPLKVDGLSLNTSPDARPKRWHKSNASARTQKKLAEKVTSAEQIMFADRSHMWKFAKRMRIQGIMTLIANQQSAVPESQLAENAVHKNS